MDIPVDVDVPQSLARKPRNWDVLKALESVSPPSPSPSFGSDFIATLASSGEIPIFLDPGDSENATEMFDAGMAGQRMPISSVSTGTMGTFGLRRQVLDSFSDVRASYCNQDSRISSRYSSGYVTPTNSSQYLSPRAERGYYDHRLSSGASRFTLSAYLSPKKKKVLDTYSLPGSPRTSPGSSAWTTPSPSSDTLSLPDTYHRSPSIGASLSTIVFAAGSAASPTLSASIVTEAQLYASRHRQRAGSSTPTYPRQADLQASSARSLELGRSRTPTFRPAISQPSSPLSGAVLTRDSPRIRTLSSTTTGSNDSGRSGRSGRSAHSARSARSSRSAHSTLIGPPVNSSGEPSITVPELPSVLSWLQNVRLELWIDQEGFRLVRPVFKLSGYNTASHDDSYLDLAHALTHGAAEFCLDEPQTFIFHHGALDPPPVLRKLTLVGEDSYDYISRQASLAIKANGIYSVSGNESFDTVPPSAHHRTHSTPHQQPLKLTWRFEYRVEDGRGKVHAGDKALTPLSFSCSPGLLHPRRGKKVRIMQVVKKGLTPKLTSEKLGALQSDVRIRVQMEPPGDILHIRGATHGENRLHDSHAGPFFRHRRIQSTSAPPLFSQENKDSAEGNRSGLKKNRTASLTIGSSTVRVEARPERPLVPSDPLIASLGTNRRNSTGTDDIHRRLSRHILPPTQLSNMLDERPSPYATDTVESLRPPPRNSRHV